MVKIWLAIFTTLLSLPSLTHAAVFTASIDRQQLNLNEKLTLTLSLSNSDTRLRAEGVDPTIDISVLHRDFDVGVPQASNRYNIYQGRGRSTSELRIALYPKRPGQLTIPSFRVDGAQTEEITVEVVALAPDQAPEVFVRKGSNLTTLWEGEQLVVFLDIYHRVKLLKAKMSDILETEPQRIELLPHWKLPQDKFQSKQFGFNYEVQRLAWALFPDKAGRFSVYLPSIDVTTSEGRSLRFPHQKLDFNIRPLPEEVPPDIIIGKPEISYTRLPTHIKQHQLSHWSVTIRAPVAVGGLPNYLPQERSVDELKIYPDRAVRESLKSSAGITDQARYTFSLMPLISGPLSVPPISIPYFDTETGTLSLFEVPKQAITIEAADGIAPFTDMDRNTFGSPQEIRHTLVSPWPLAALLFACLWLLTLAYVVWNKVKTAPQKQQAPTKKSTAIDHEISEGDRLKQQVLEALGTKTLAEGIEGWQKNHPEQSQIKNTLAQLQRYYYGPPQHGDKTLPTQQINKALKTIKESPKTRADQTSRWLTETFQKPSDSNTN